MIGWKFYSIRRGADLKALLKSGAFQDYKGFCQWCTEREVNPPPYAEVKSLFEQRSKPARVKKAVVSPSKPSSKLTGSKKQSVPATKSKKQQRSSKKTGISRKK